MRVTKKMAYKHSVRFIPILMCPLRFATAAVPGQLQPPTRELAIGPR